MAWNSSYVYGYDNVSGWGGRYFFTYFNEFGPHSTAAKVLEVFAFITIFIVSVMTNVAIVCCVYRFPDMRTVTNSFVLNLAAADLLFALSIPAIAYARLTTAWMLGNVACKLIPYSQFVAGIVLLWTLTLISTDRHRCIVLPPNRAKITTRQASYYAAIIWTLTAFMFLPVLMWFRQQETIDGRYVCTIIFPMSARFNIALCFLIPLLLIACLLPMVILVVNYQKIFKKILSTKNTWGSSCVMVSSSNVPGGKSQTRRQSEVSLSDIFAPWPRKTSNSQMSNSNGRHGSLSQQEEIRLNKHIKVVRVLFLNVVVVLLMWLPITITMLLIFIDGRRPLDDNNYFLRSYHFIGALIIAYINTVVNPLLYGVLSDSFRASLIKLCCGKKPDAQPETGHENGNMITKDNNTITPSSCRNNAPSKSATTTRRASENPQDII